MNKNTPVFSFDKSNYLPSSQIEKLYEQKIKKTSDQNVLTELQRAILYDPRRDDIYFSSVVLSQKAKTVADKLHTMSENEFIKNDYSYQWVSILTGGSIYKIVNPSVLTSPQPNDRIQTILNIVNSSKRKMPAHFTSNEDRTQSFCIDFDISEEDEYAMANEAWRSSTDPLVTKVGEDIMLASFIAVKLGAEEFIFLLYKNIVETYSVELSKKHKVYLEHCSNFGKLRAKS